MARTTFEKDMSGTLSAAEEWIQSSLIEDRSLFNLDPLWTLPTIEAVNHAFAENPDTGSDDFMTKMRKQMASASPSAQRLVAEMLWALLLFPSNMKPRTKKQQVCDLLEMSGLQVPTGHRLLNDDVLKGIGSGGPGFNNYRFAEMVFLIDLVRDIKRRDPSDRRRILTDYDAFIGWIDAVPQEGSRQFRHMLRYFAFPDRVERMSSNNDRRSILAAFGVASMRDLQQWSDRQLDDALFSLRGKLAPNHPSPFDFYMPGVREQWAKERKVPTPDGEVIVTVPTDQDEEDIEIGIMGSETPTVRHSLQVQAALAEIGSIMGFRVWLPRNDRGRIEDLVTEDLRRAFADRLPLNYDQATLETIEQIDVLWLKGRSIVRAFEVEHTTAVYSGLLRMADLLALQPNMDIKLHIVAPDERRDKVFREMQRPIFSLLDRGPLSNMCTFLSYESVNLIRRLEHLSYTTDRVITEYEERVAGI